MNESKRPLTRYENQIRLLYEYVDEIIGRLDVIKSSVDKLERLEIMLHGAEGAPGLIEVIEWLSFEVSRVERLGTVLPSGSSREIDGRLIRIEALLSAYSKTRVVKNHKASIGRADWVLVILLLLIGGLTGGGGLLLIQATMGGW